MREAKARTGAQQGFAKSGSAQVTESSPLRDGVKIRLFTFMLKQQKKRFTGIPVKRSSFHFHIIHFLSILLSVAATGNENRFISVAFCKL